MTSINKRRSQTIHKKYTPIHHQRNNKANIPLERQEIHPKTFPFRKAIGSGGKIEKSNQKFFPLYSPRTCLSQDVEYLLNARLPTYLPTYLPPQTFPPFLVIPFDVLIADTDIYLRSPKESPARLYLLPYPAHQPSTAQLHFTSVVVSCLFSGRLVLML